MSEEIKDHDFKSGEWFYALDGAVYEFIDDEKGSRKICEVVYLEKTAFMSGSMKKRGHILAAAHDMYDFLDSIADGVLDESQNNDLLRLLAKARGENEAHQQ